MQEGITAPDYPRRHVPLRRIQRDPSVYRRRRVRFAAAFVVFCLAIAAVVIFATSDSSTTQVDTQALALLATPASDAAAPVATTGEERPAFARLGDRNLVLPVAASEATIIAYQPISDERTVALTPIGEKANTNALVRFFRSIFAGDASVRYHQLPGDGPSPTNSVLIGAPAGSAVTSPVSGIVTGVKKYKLYGKHDDVQIEIRPESLSGTTVILMLISDPAVSIGTVVNSGKTPLGKVRECPPELANTISCYTHDSGAHIHLKVTEEPVS
jgi:hypothetical protein